MAIPLIWVGYVAVGAATAWALSGSDDGGSSSSNDRYDKEQEARKKADEERKKRLFEDIEIFKKREIGRIEQKYNAQSVHNELIASSTKFLQQLKSKFGNSFISFTGNVKEEIVARHFEQLGSIAEEGKKITDEFRLEDSFDFQDIANNFKDFFAVMESIQNDERKIIDTLKNKYFIEKSYQKAISTYKIFHNNCMNDEVIEMIIKHIWDNISLYENNFNNSRITIVEIDKRFDLQIKVLENEQEELNQLINQLKKEQNATKK